jgi:hypothetical protein
MSQDEQNISLESQLRGIPLREPTLSLDARVNDLFAKSRARQSRRLTIHRFAIAAGVLIAIGIGLQLSLPKHQSPQIAKVVVPHVDHAVQIERDTSTVYDDGIVATTGEAAYQQIRRRTVREIWYVDPATHAQLQMTIPTEQILIQKVDAY